MQVCCPECNKLENISEALPTRRAVADACELDENGVCPMCSVEFTFTIGDNGRVETLGRKIT